MANGYSNGRPNGNGNGNGHANGNGNGKKNGNGRKPCHVSITLQRHGSDEDDAELLRQVCRLLSSWHGQDSYELCIATPSGKAYLTSPNAMTSFNTELEAELKQILGPSCLTVRDSDAVTP